MDTWVQGPATQCLNKLTSASLSPAWLPSCADCSQRFLWVMCGEGKHQEQRAG